MTTDRAADDVRAIENLIERQFRSLGWSDGRGGDWSTFAADFFDNATLYPAARPVRPQSVEEFIARMKGLAGTSLRSFHERVLGTEIHAFGNVAVAFAAFENLENEGKIARGVEALLLIKDQGTWRIVSRAWDTESEDKRLPDYLENKSICG